MGKIGPRVELILVGNLDDKRRQCPYLWSAAFMHFNVGCNRGVEAG